MIGRSLRHRWRIVVAVVVLIVSVVAVVRVWSGAEETPTVTASSVDPGSSLSELVSEGDVSGRDPGWRSDEETIGAWVDLKWSSPVEMREVVLERDSLERDGVVAGFLTFSDGSDVQVRLSATSRTTVVPVTTRVAQGVRFTVTSVSEGAKAVALTRFAVGNRAADGGVATEAAADGDAAGGARVTSSAAETRELWTLEDPTGGWLQLDWTQPRELTTIAVAGARAETGSTAGSEALLSSGTLEFSDGSSLAIGAVLADPARPTVVSFMPRVTTSVRLTVDSVSGPGALVLAEISAFQVGAPPQGVAGGAEMAFRDIPVDCGQPPARPTDEVGLVVLCPTTGAEVQDEATVVVATGPSYAEVSATVWPSDVEAVVPASLETTAATDGTASFDLDLRELPPGPLTVRLVATPEEEVSPREVFFQLYRTGPGSAPTPQSGAAARGRSLVYSEEFDRPLSISRTGEGADYSAAKPGVGDVQDFGDAIFADPAAGLGNVRVVDEDYLKMSVTPRPADFADPQGWGREHVGGMLASARPGGSGFSAQYGYFEARMQAPAAPGTWPAFWMLPSPNLVSDQPVVAEIDAVELYGHDPTAACHTTHQYPAVEGVGLALCGTRWNSDREALAWHTYGVSVDPTGVKFYIDDELVGTAPQVEGGDEPLFFLVDLALGGGWPVDLTSVQDRAELYVDYIRVYV